MVLGCARVAPPYVSTSVTGDGNVILVKRVRDLIAGYDNLSNRDGMAWMGHLGLLAVLVG